MLEHPRYLLAHAEWANAVFFHQWGKSTARENDELRRRVEHIIMVQDAFLSVLRGVTPRFPGDHPPPPFDDLKRSAQTSHAALAEFVEKLQESDLERTVTMPWFPDPPCRISVAEALTQVALHAQHHRGQCMTRLKDAGGEPKDVDFIIWLWRGKPKGRWA